MARACSHLDEAVAESEGYAGDARRRGAARPPRAEGILLGLTTGNVEAAAHIKLGRAGLSRFFCFGGYGSDSAERAELARRRVERAVRIAAAASSRRVHRRRRHAPRRRRRPRRWDPGRRRRDRPLVVEPSCARPAPTGRWRPSPRASRPEVRGSAPGRSGRRPRRPEPVDPAPAGLPAAGPLAGSGGDGGDLADVGLAVVAGQLLQGAWARPSRRVNSDRRRPRDSNSPAGQYWPSLPRLSVLGRWPSGAACSGCVEARARQRHVDRAEVLKRELPAPRRQVERLAGLLAGAEDRPVVPGVLRAEHRRREDRRRRRGARRVGDLRLRSSRRSAAASVPSSRVARFLGDRPGALPEDVGRGPGDLAEVGRRLAPPAAAVVTT